MLSLLTKPHIEVLPTDLLRPSDRDYLSVSGQRFPHMCWLSFHHQTAHNGNRQLVGHYCDVLVSVLSRNVVEGSQDPPCHVFKSLATWRRTSQRIAAELLQVLLILLLNVTIEHT